MIGKEKVGKIRLLVTSESLADAFVCIDGRVAN